MSEHDYVIDDQNGLSFLADLNAMAAAIVSNNSKATAPTTMYAYMWWTDTTAGLRKQRNAANSAWIVRDTLAETLVIARSSNTIIGVGDYSRTIVATGTFTQTFTAAATLGDGFFIQYRNNGTGVITLDPDGSETIDLGTTLLLYPGQSCLIYGNGTAFVTIGRNGDTHYAVASGTDTYTATLAPAPAAYITGRVYPIKFTNASTSTTPTINLNTLGAITIVRANSAVLGVGEIQAGMVLDLLYDGTNMVAQNLSASTSAAVKVAVRQCILSALLNSTGYNSAITAGSGLACDLDGTPSAFTLTFAAGFDSNGNVDYVGQISSDQASYWSSLAANTLTFLGIERNSSTGALTSYKTILPTQYANSYDKSAQELLRFAGADTSTTITSDYGNTWTAAGNAQIDTAVTINGLNTLLLDGTGDYIANTGMATLGSGSWTVEFKHRRAVAGTAQRLLTFTNAGSFGLKLHWATDNKIELYLSSNGSSDDIVNGTKTTNAFSSTVADYHIAVTFDQIAGKYYVYVDGVKETEISSTTLVHAAHTLWRIGADASGTNGLNGYVAGFRFSPCCRYPNGTTFTAPDISTFTVGGHYFSVPAMTLYEVTSASASAGTDPGMTATQRVFIGEATTGAATVSSVTNYALRGKYISPLTTIPSLGTRTAFSHNIGVIPWSEFGVVLENIIPEWGHTLAGRTRPNTYSSDGQPTSPSGAIETRNTCSITVGDGGQGFLITDRSNGVKRGITAINWKMQIMIDRGW